MEEDKINDFIQQAVNKCYEQSMDRAIRRIRHKEQLAREKRNKIRKARKAERKNRRGGK